MPHRSADSPRRLPRLGRNRDQPWPHRRADQLVRNPCRGLAHPGSPGAAGNQTRGSLKPTTYHQICRRSQQSVFPRLSGPTSRIWRGCPGRITAMLAPVVPEGLAAPGAVGLVAARCGAEDHAPPASVSNRGSAGPSSLQQLAELLDRLAEAAPFTGPGLVHLRRRGSRQPGRSSAGAPQAREATSASGDRLSLTPPRGCLAGRQLPVRARAGPPRPWR